MQSGDLSERVQVRTETTTPDGAGGYTVTTGWGTAIPAKVEPVRGQERVIADRERGVQGYKLTVRNIGAGRAITTGDVLLWRGTEMNVRSAPEVGRAQFRMLEAESGVINP